MEKNSNSQNVESGKKKDTISTKFTTTSKTSKLKMEEISDPAEGKDGKKPDTAAQSKPYKHHHRKTAAKKI